MGRKITPETRKELVSALAGRYRESMKKDKARILDEFVALSGYHRKHAIRMLAPGGPHGPEPTLFPEIIPGRRVYDEAVKEAVIMIWEVADRICGKRLKAILGTLVEAMERHSHLNLDPVVRARLLKVSAATIDRWLSPIRDSASSRRRRRRVRKISRQVPVRTFADWGQPSPGYFEIDLVAHSGESMTGSFLHTLVATDVCSGWTEFMPLLVREQSLVVEGLEMLIRRIPFSVRGIDSDNDSAFINDTVQTFCQHHQIAFTRSRAYQKNDQAWVEQKNGSVIRRMVGYERFSGMIAGQAMAHLYHWARLYVNYFQPSFKLRNKRREGARVHRTYDPPATPCERLLKHPAIDETTGETLLSQRASLDPVELLHHIRQSQAALAALGSGNTSPQGPGHETLNQFLAQLPRLWRAGEVRPTHRTPAMKPRSWRTREDPFETVWYDVLDWLQREPDITAKALFKSLQHEHAGRFPDSQLRTLQRRVKEWRQVMARKLVSVCVNENGETPEVQVIA